MRKVFMFLTFVQFIFDWRIRVDIRLTYRTFNINFVLAVWRDEDWWRDWNVINDSFVSSPSMSLIPRFALKR